MSDHTHHVITLSRQMGSGGTYLGYLLAEKLGFQYVDREIVRRAAEAFNTDVASLSHLDEKSSGLLANVLRSFAVGTPEVPNIYPIVMPVYDHDLYIAECRIMNEIADKQDSVFIGRAGFHALKERAGAIHIFTHAPIDFRVKRLMQVHSTTDAKHARAEIEKSDAQRARFIKDMAGLHWIDARNYHLCLDMSKVSFEASLEMIMNMLKG